MASPPNPPRSLPAKAKPERPKDANWGKLALKWCHNDWLSPVHIVEYFWVPEKAALVITNGLFEVCFLSPSYVASAMKLPYKLCISLCEVPAKSTSKGRGPLNEAGSFISSQIASTPKSVNFLISSAQKSLVSFLLKVG